MEEALAPGLTMWKVSSDSEVPDGAPFAQLTPEELDRTDGTNTL